MQEAPRESKPKKKNKQITETHFNKYGNIYINGEEIGSYLDNNVRENVNLLNVFLFLVTVVEVLVRFYRTKKGHVFSYEASQAIRSDAFPVAIAQSRSLILLFGSKITFNDFFGQKKR